MALSDTTNPSEIVQIGTFLLEGRLFGVNILFMREIIRPLNIIKVPRAPMGMEGVINLRGEIIPIISLRSKLGMPLRPFDKETRIINIEVDGMIAGFLVDAIGHVKQIRANTIQEPPAVSTSGETAYLSGIIQDGDDLIMTLSLEQLIEADMFKDIIS